MVKSTTKQKQHHYTPRAPLSPSSRAAVKTSLPSSAEPPPPVAINRQPQMRSSQSCIVDKTRRGIIYSILGILAEKTHRPFICSSVGT